MKKLILLFLIIPLISFGQSFEVEEIQIDSGANAYQGTFKKFKPLLVLEVNGSPVELYNKTINWVNETYKNPDEVIKGKVEGKYVRINGFASNMITQNVLGTIFYYNIRYSIEIKFKENKFRYEVTKMEQYFEPSSVSSGGWYEIPFNFKVAKRKGKANKKTGIRKEGKTLKYGVETYERIKAYFENLGIGLKEYMENTDNAEQDGSDDDW
tara:strand:- start:47 stop:679 length:633 start_codon:yes stop_codon:yes gene_type:complete